MYNDLFTVFGLTVHGYGLMIGLGFILAVLLTSWRAKRLGLSPDIATDLALIAVVTGFLGAKLLYLLVEFKAFLQNPLALLGSSGFVVYGGIISGVLCCILYCRHKKVSFLEYFDLLIPAVAVNQGFGRIGCFLAGCCYGRPTDSFCGVVFPAGSLAPSGIPLLPTQLFSAAGDFLLAALLLVFFKRLKHRGSVGASYLTLYGVGRFVIEFLRDDARGSVGIFSTSQFISLFFVAGGLFLLWRTFRLPVRRDRPLSDREDGETAEGAGTDVSVSVDEQRETAPEGAEASDLPGEGSEGGKAGEE